MSISWTAGPPPDAMKDGREVLVYAYGRVFVAWWGDGKSWWEPYEWSAARIGSDESVEYRTFAASEIKAWSEANPPEGAE